QRPELRRGERQGLGRSQPGVQVAPGQEHRDCRRAGLPAVQLLQVPSEQTDWHSDHQPAAAVAGKPFAPVRAPHRCESLNYSGERACDHVFLQWLSQWDI
uniref:Calponin-homology (CH) domain-containing protein n=1 Tax=Macrostomum lignano TaxID=282301 RepID=A0A1I8H535_9PLAT